MAAARLLLVDDDESSRRTFCEILRRGGYDVVSAASGEDGVGLLRRGRLHLDLILTDLRLPGMSGLEVLVAARQYRPHVPAIMYSADATTESQRAALRLGAAEFVYGPIWAEDMVSAVDRHLPRRSADASHVIESAAAGPAAMRWATLLMTIVHAENDLSTEDAWGKAVGKSLATLKVWSAAAGVHAKDSLDFGRGFRIAFRHAGQIVTLRRWYDLLDIIDARTLQHFLERGGLPRDGQIPAPADFLRRQRFITQPDLITAVRQLLRPPE